MILPEFMTREIVLRFAVFAMMFALMAGLEALRPRRRLHAPKVRRWLTNMTIVGIDTLLVRAMAVLPVPFAAVAASAWAGQNGVGLLNSISLPLLVAIALALVVLDFAIWLQHLLAHRIPVLWRLHQMHHADPDIDVTTAIRFHPLEIAFSMLYKIAWVLVLGPSPLAVIVFEIVLNACALFNHANVALPSKLERGLRLLVVTPDMHRIHHSTLPREHHSNFGFNLSIWDRLFGTYTAEPALGHAEMGIGLEPLGRSAPVRILWSLLLPFRAAPPRS